MTPDEAAPQRRDIRPAVNMAESSMTPIPQGDRSYSWGLAAFSRGPAPLICTLAGQALQLSVLSYALPGLDFHRLHDHERGPECHSCIYHLSLSASCAGSPYRIRIQVVVLEVDSAESQAVGEGVDAVVACQAVLAADEGGQGGAVLQAGEV